ncbi:transcriptional regulator [Lactococcus lactis subsp. lactis]|uniref:transcriptional regulator n=1 Tax=Lactococcus lactis TaxID=1358 RepID=UPI00300DDE96
MSRRYKLSRRALETLDEKLYNYKDIENAIAVRKVEMEGEKTHYERAGGSSNRISKPVEDLVISWDEDEALRGMYAFRDQVDKLRRKINQDETMTTIFELRWLSATEPSWEEIGDSLFISRAQIYRKRQILLELFDKCCGGVW